MMAMTDSSWERTRSFFPVTRSHVYLNHAGVAPISSRVAEAVERYLLEATRHGAARYAETYDADTAGPVEGAVHVF